MSALKCLFSFSLPCPAPLVGGVLGVRNAQALEGRGESHPAKKSWMLMLPFQHRGVFSADTVYIEVLSQMKLGDAALS